MEFDIVHGYIWLALGLLLGVVEMVVGTYFLLALAGGALLTGIVSMLFSMSWMIEAMLFSVFCVVALGILLYWKKKHANETDLTDDITRMHGKRVTAIDAIGNGLNLCFYMNIPAKFHLVY